MNNTNLLDILNKKSFKYTCLIENKLSKKSRLLIVECKLNNLKNLLNENLKDFENVKEIKDDNNYLLSNIFYK